MFNIGGYADFDEDLELLDLVLITDRVYGGYEM